MSRLPVSLDPFVPSALNRRWEGGYDGGDLPRIRAATPQGAPISVRVALEIVLGILGEVRLRAEIDGDLGMVCQRCLRPMSWRIRLRPDLVLVRPGSAVTGLDASDELLEVGDDGLLRLAEWVEEEILLDLPLAPRHEDCAAGWGREFEPEKGDAGGGTAFSVLETLRGKT